MDKKMTSEVRQEVIKATGLCLNPDCTAHDAVVARIWDYAHKNKEDITLVTEGTIKEIIGRSFSGRTAVSKTANRGSIPRRPAKGV